MKIWSPDSPVMKKITMFTNLIFLNLLWILCCLPVATAGAATSAMYTVLFAYRKEQTDEVIKPFFSAFRSGFKQSTLIWLPVCLIIAVLCFDAVYVSSNTDSDPGVVVIPAILMAMLVVAVTTYGFPQIALFENRTGMILRNSIHLFVLNPIQSLFMALINLVPWAMLVVIPFVFILTLPFWLLCGFSLGAYLNSGLLARIFGKYLPREDLEHNDT